jgi:hypothetical protein
VLAITISSNLLLGVNEILIIFSFQEWIPSAMSGERGQKVKKKYYWNCDFNTHHRYRQLRMWESNHTDFLDVIPCRLVVCYGHFGGICSLHLSSILKMKAACVSSKTSVL